MKPIVLILLTVSALFIAGCSTPPPAEATPQQVSYARTRLLELTPDLDAGSRAMIRTNTPITTYLTFQYGGARSYNWEITSNRIASLQLIKTLDNPPTELATIHPVKK